MDADTILQYCLEEIEAGRLTARECAARFPGAEGLEGQLVMAETLRAQPGPALSPAASKAIEAQLRARVRRLQRTSQAGLAARLARAWSGAWLRWSLVLAVLVVLLVGAAGTVSAAEDSLPGDWLYGVKRTAESVRLALASPVRQASLLTELVHRRADELLALSQRDADPAVIVAAIADAEAAAQAALDAAAQVPLDEQATVLSGILTAMDRQQTVLTMVKTAIPLQALASIDQALAAGEERRERVETLLVLAGNGPNAPPGQTHVPPGQTNVPPGQTHVPPGQTHVPPGQTHVPPGQTNVPPGQTNVPPGQTHVPPGQTNVPPGQARQTTSPTPEPSHTPRPEPGGGRPTQPPFEPNCQAGSPNSPNFCTPTVPPGDGAGNQAPPATIAAPVEPTPCPTNPGGQPKCGP